MMTAEELKTFAKATLKDETSTDEQKAAAKKAIRRVEARAERRKGLPKRPKRNDYETEAAHHLALKDFRSVLDKAAVVREASKVLDDPNSSVYLRRKARETLYGPDPEPEPVKVAENETPEKPTRSRLSTAEALEEQKRAQEFLDFIGKHGLPAETPRRQPDPKKVEPPPKPVDPALYCELCRTPFQICGCNAIACPICLQPKANCCAPCPRARVR